tara:strand:+ start:383 stop:550 length:168 start_codon:yes stop_codon:yes gene_type:complete
MTHKEECINTNICNVVKDIRKEIKSILKDFHYNSDVENMSKDVVVALENLVGELK